MIFLFAPRADVFHCVSLQSEPVKGGAHTSGAGLHSKSMRRGEPKTSLGLAANAFEMLEARSCHTLLVRHPAHCRRAHPAPGAIVTRLHSPVASIQGAQTIQGGQQQSNLSRRQILSFAATSPGGRLMGLRSTVQNLGRHVGAWGKICARQTCRCEGQTAAHGQITERKPSVAQFRFLFLFHEGGQLHPTP